VGNELDSGLTRGGVFFLEGVPKSFEPEKEYSLKIVTFNRSWDLRATDDFQS
jgi:hypothetical protein